MFEAVLARDPLPETADQTTAQVLLRLNDYVGHRPIAVLETRPRGEPYDHERVRPIPLYLRGAGVAHGPYRELHCPSVLRSSTPRIPRCSPTRISTRPSWRSWRLIRVRTIMPIR